jgi:signal transduction histidine kinase
LIEYDENPEEKTEVICDADTIVKITLNLFANAKISLDNCIDSNTPSILTIPNHPITKGHYDMSKRGVRIRFITEVTRENLVHCKELMNFGEVRHLDEIKGNFGILDGKYYQAGAKTNISLPPPLLVHSTVKAMVEQQQYFFEMLWDKAIPWVQRIEEIEYGIKRDVTKTLQNTDDIQKLSLQLIRSAKSNILLIQSDFKIAQDEYTDKLFHVIDEKLANDKQVKLKILLPVVNESDRDEDRLINLASHQKENIEIRYLEKELQNQVSILIVDDKFLLSSAFEHKMRAMEKKTPSITKGLATYTNNEPTVLSYVHIFEALWKQSELYQTIKESNAKLQRFNESQKEFIDIAAHELRNPIMPILNVGIDLQSSWGEFKDSEKITMIDTIVRNARRLRRLTEELLDTAKIENHLLTLKLENYDITKQIVEIIQDYDSNQMRKNHHKKDERSFIKFMVDCEDDKEIIINADKSRISQVIVNLLDNAVKFIGRRRPKEIVATINEIVGEKKEVIVSVSNTGNIIDHSMLPKLFQKFSGISDTGTGLGLFICRGIIEAHGGRIWAENKVNGLGTIFSFSIPLKHI